MKKLSENIFNKGLRQDQPKLSLWRHAGLMLTYKCPAACEFCYYNCSPDKGGLMPVDTALNAWSSMIDLAGDYAEIHITGGEPFLYFDYLAELTERAKNDRLTGLDAIETNACWATDSNTIIKRLTVLKQNGLRRLKISWDPFHAQFIEAEKVILLAQTAPDVLGRDNVLVRWAKYLDKDIDMKALDIDQRWQLYKETRDSYSVRFTGRAAGKLADLYADKSPQSLANLNCNNYYLSAKGVHIDPYGNVFSGLCSGIIIGNVNQKPLMNIWQEFDPATHPLVADLCQGGPTALIHLAEEQGYKIRPKYAGKCHLCTDLRQFFFDKGQKLPIIGPSECYF